MTVFIHSWFRSGSTWLWKKLRQADGIMALYEPLNEELPFWTPERLKSAPVRAFEGDNHPDLDNHYYYEYLDLIATNELRFAKSLSYERYLLGAPDQNEELESYVNNLIRFAENRGQRAALSFCRSQMRSGWFAAKFDAVNIAQVRNPVDQWISFGKHQYFTQRTLLTAYCLSRQVPDALIHVEGFGELETAWRSGRSARISELGCFTVFSTLWICSTIHALINSEIAVDVDQLSHDTNASKKIEEMLSTHGLRLDLSDCQVPSSSDGKRLERLEMLFADNLEKFLASNAPALLLPPKFQMSDLKLDFLSHRSAEYLRKLKSINQLVQ